MFLNLLLFYSFSAGAVMLPEYAVRDLNLPNPLQRKTLSDHIKDVNQTFVKATKGLILPQFSSLTYDLRSTVDPQKEAEHFLDSLFYMSFKSLPMSQFQEYHKVYFEDQWTPHLRWVGGGQKKANNVSLMGKTTETSPLRLYGMEYYSPEKYSLKISESFREFSVITKFLKLSGLLRLEAHRTLIENLGGLGVYREIHPKVQMIGDIYESYVLFEIARLIFIGLGIEYSDIVHPDMPVGEEWLQLDTLLQSVGVGHVSLWHGHLISGFAKELKPVENQYFELNNNLIRHFKKSSKESQLSSPMTCGLMLLGGEGVNNKH